MLDRTNLQAPGGKRTSQTQKGSKDEYNTSIRMTRY
jgi:hypothetical protein